MNLISIGTAVRGRREELGLTQSRLAQLSGLSRQTLVGLENGSLNDLGVNRAGQVLAVLGLAMQEPSTENRRVKRGLVMASRTASVSYANELTPETLAQILASGEVPEIYIAHMAHLLDEAPISMVVMAVEESAAAVRLPPREIWRNVARVAAKLSVHRKKLWT